MNDFTKEELETIYLDMNHTILKYGKVNIAPFYLALRDKVENMIDNYCDHESDGKSYCPGLYDKVCAGDEINANDLTRVSKCSKCYRYFE